MRHDELVRRFAFQNRLTIKHARQLIANLFAVISAGVAEHGVVRIVDFGTFQRATRKARRIRSPKTREVIDLPETTTVAFRAAADLKRTARGG